MRVSSIRSTNINHYQKPFMGKTVEKSHLPYQPSEEFKRQRNNVFTMLFPILIASIGCAVAYLMHKAGKFKNK